MMFKDIKLYSGIFKNLEILISFFYDLNSVFTVLPLSLLGFGDVHQDEGQYIERENN